MKKIICFLLFTVVLNASAQIKTFTGHIDQIICVDYCDIIFKTKTNQDGESLRLVFEADGKTLKLDNASKAFFIVKENYVELAPQFKGKQFTVTCTLKSQEYIVNKLELFTEVSQSSVATTNQVQKTVSVKNQTYNISYADKPAYFYYEPTKMLYLKDNRNFAISIRVMIKEVENKFLQGKRYFKIDLDKFYGALFSPNDEAAYKEFRNYNCSFNKLVFNLQDSKQVTIEQPGPMNCDAKIENTFSEEQKSILSKSPIVSIAIVNDTKGKTYSFDVPKEEQTYFMDLIADINQINSGAKSFK
ncbi:MAG: hypothetical protein KA163_05040 [Bacteroidia bacterium]|nr:hypothetical protein [Bacteroidia bacterium]